MKGKYQNLLEDYQSIYTGEQIDDRLTKAGNAVQGVVMNGVEQPKDAEGKVNLSGVATQSYVAEETQAVFDAAARLVATERNRAEAAEGLIKSIADSKLTRVDLACDGYEPLKITYRGQTEALTFAEIYELVTDKSKFVTLLDSEMFILLPSLSIDGDAIEFAGINITNYQAEAQRVIINQENQVSVYPIELEDSGRKVSSAEGISGADAFIKYPNVKALQDYVAAHGGGLTPEQEAKLNDAVTARDAEGSGVPALPFATKAEVGNLADLQTTDKSNIVNAINEVAQGGGSDWELIAEITTTEEVTNINITQDKDGNAFRLREMQVVCEVVPTSSNTSEDSLRIRTNVNSAAKGGQFSPFARMFRSSGITQPAVSQMAINGGYRCATNYGVTYVNPADSTILSADKVEDYSAVFLQATSGVCKFGIGSTIKVYGKRI